jgi:hypothetical protein
VHRRSWPSRRELTSEVFDYIEAFYNRVRRHSTHQQLAPESPNLSGEPGELQNDTYAAAEEAQAKLALPRLPDLVAELEVPRGAFSGPSTVKPSFGFPGSGTERVATEPVPGRVVRHRMYGGPH